MQLKKQWFPILNDYINDFIIDYNFVIYMYCQLIIYKSLFWLKDENCIKQKYFIQLSSAMFHPLKFSNIYQEINKITWKII
jgi:hypothetical protein